MRIFTSLVPPPPSTSLVETKAFVKPMVMYIHLVACQHPLEHQKEEEEEDLTFLPSKLGRTKTL